MEPTKREFHNLGELEDVKNSLARATMHPVYADLGEVVSNDGQVSGPGGEHKRVESRRVIWNNRSDEPAYFASDEYRLSQHRDVLDYIQEAIDHTTGSIEMGMIRDYGEVVDGVIVFDGENATIDVTELVGDGYVPPEEDVDPHGNARARDRLGLGMRFKNSFDGSVKIQAETMGYRFICQNWMVWGKETIGVDAQLHINELDPAFFQDLILEVFDTKDDTEDLILEMATEEVPINWVPKILEQIGFGRNYRNRICGHVDEYRNGDYVSLWEIYNAATFELDNNAAQRVGSDVYQEHQNRVGRIISGDWSEPEETTDFEAIVA